MSLVVPTDQFVGVVHTRAVDSKPTTQGEYLSHAAEKHVEYNFYY